MKNKKWLGQFSLGLAFIVGGGFILFQNEAFLKVLMILLGVMAIVNGTVSLVTMNRYAFGPFNRNATIVKGILSLVVGVLAVIMPLVTAETTWMVFVYVLAVQMVISGVITLITAVAVRSSSFSAKPMVWEGLISLAAAVILFLFPEDIGTLLVRILGIAIVVVGITIAALALRARKEKDGQTLHDVEVEVLSDS